MSAPECHTTDLVHWVEAGDPGEAKKHGLTVKAYCGFIYVPTGKSLSSRPPCLKCESLNGIIRGTKGRPPKSGEDGPHYVYRCFDAEDRLIYVGCTRDLNTRRLAHSHNSWWYPQMVSHRVTIYPDRETALRVERGAIIFEQPLWNVRHQVFRTWPAEQLSLAHGIASEYDAPEPVMRRLNKLGGVA